MAGKLYARILESRLSIPTELSLENTQCGFRRHRETQDHIFSIRKVTNEKAIQRERAPCSIDMEKAFDRIKRKDV